MEEEEREPTSEELEEKINLEEDPIDVDSLDDDLFDMSEDDEDDEEDEKGFNIVEVEEEDDDEDNM